MSKPTPEGYRPGVGIMLVDAADRVFVGHRIDTREAAWQMPQGGIDHGETPLQAAYRELKEETGTDRAELIAESRDWFTYDLPPDIAARIWNGRYRGQCQKWFLMRHVGAEAEIDLATAHPEFDAWRWVRPEELPDLIIPFKRQLYIDILAEFRSRFGNG